MKNKPLISLAVASLALLGAALLHFGAGSTGSNSASAARCRAELASRGPDAQALQSQCGDPAFAAAITAQDAGTAARNIGAANQGSILTNALTFGLFGFGLVLTLVGLFGLRRRR